MTESEHDNPAREASTPTHTSPLGLLLRAMLPIVLLAGGALLYSRLSVESEEKEGPPEEKRLIRTKVVELHSTDYPVVMNTHGIVQSHNEAALSAQVSGTIIDIHPSFEVGAFFAKDDVLVELDPRDYKTSVAIAEARKASAEAALLLATQDRDRILDLFENDNIGTQADVDEAIATQAQAAAELESVVAQLDQAKRDLERTTIRAPFDGRVRMKNVGLGQTVNPGTGLGVIFAVDYAEVRLPIGARERAFLDLPEMEGDPTVPAVLRDSVNEENETVWDAKIVRTEGTLDADSLELFAIARIDDPFGLKSGHAPLRIGQPVEASITGETLTDVVPLPRRAVRELDRIYLINDANAEKQTLMSMTVEPIWSDAEYVLVRDPMLHDGSLLCTTHMVYAPEGAEVEIIPDIDTPETTRKRSAADGIDS